ncbi:MAG: ImmA/IrrE family metallo-endopeptidase [Clostridia bacterium]|nr:ImmA/IrrE family metallo-endopeptidase [Clostridia bacterium]
MTRLQGLYETADGLGLQICYFPMEQLTAISTPDGFIGMDVDKLEDSARETVCLAHEMGHCLTGSFYTVDSSLQQRRRCEERADRWAMDRLVPLEELKGLLKAGMTRPDELAEYFGVPEDFLLRCVAYYKEAKGAL